MLDFKGMMMVLNNIIATIIENGSGDAERLVDTLFTHPVFRYQLIIFFCKWMILLLSPLKKMGSLEIILMRRNYRCSSYAKFRSLITFMLASCRYEDVLLKETVRCIEGETIQMYLFLFRIISYLDCIEAQLNLIINNGQVWFTNNKAIV